MRFVDDSILFLGPGGLLHLRVEVVVPTLSTLLAYAALQVLSDNGPPLRAVFVYQFNHL